IAPTIAQGRVTAWDEHLTSPEWAVTAAHCVVNGAGQPEPKSRFSILGGSLSASDDNGVGEIQSVVDIYIPLAGDIVRPFNFVTLESDIALLRLSGSQKHLNSTQRRAIRLPTASEAAWIYSAYTAVHTAGWGRTAAGPSTAKLQEIR